MDKILITGGAGYIGSILSTDLVNLGYEVVVLDNFRYSTSSLDHLLLKKNFKLVNANILDKNLLKKYLSKCNTIIPLAALVGADLCNKFKRLAKDTNYSIIKFIIDNLNNKQKIIFTNTNSGYGIGGNKYCNENSPLNPISLYGQTKALAEKEVMRHNNYVSLRLATVFGFSYRMRTDLLVNNFVYNAVHKNKISLYEENFRRNFIHVKDVSEAIIKIINKFNYFKNNIYNLGLSNANLTKLQLAKKIKKNIKSLIIIKHNNKSDPDKRDYFVSNRKIENKGIYPKVSLDEGIVELIEVFKKNKGKIINNY
jgi:nucleoside-diphosphate-sugar epimerase